MRKAFIAQLMELARTDKRIMLLTGDLGYTVLEPFQQEFPERFYNVGVAEQNMIGVATGLADAGLIPFVYSIATFATLRGYEFIRNGPVLHQLPVRIVGTGGGFEYDQSGMTHYALEDVGVMRIQPGMTVLVPADTPQAVTMLKKTWDLPGPIYYRLSKKDGVIPQLKGKFSLGKINSVREGKDVLILGLGPAVTQAMATADRLGRKGIEAAVYGVASLQPLNAKRLVPILKLYQLIVTVEAHYVVGGLGSLVAEIIAENGLAGKLIRCGVKGLATTLGSQTYLEQQHKLSAGHIAAIIRKNL